MDGDRFWQLLYLGLLLAALGGWVLVEYRARLGQAMRAAMAWGMIFVGVMAGYGLWSDLRHDILPRQMVSAAGELIVPQAEDGHYYMNIRINGKDIIFLADTGATNLVLSRADAATLGIDIADLAFLGEATTANGAVKTARVKLAEVIGGPFRDQNVTAWVNEGEMDTSLLGMDYLGLFNIQIRDGEMVLSR